MKNIMKKNPLVSVIMPVYNAGDFLVDSIQSILNQTYQNIELIIINDASTDDSLKIINKFQNKHPQIIRLINLKKTLNRGGDASANIGLQKAKGKYIARMDADDIAGPQRLEKQVEFLEDNPLIFLVGSNADVINKKGKVIGEKIVPETSEEIRNNYFTFHPIIHPTVLFRKNLKGKKFSYQIKYSANNDYLTFFRIVCQGVRFANLPEKLIQYRIHGKNDTFSNIKEKYFNTLKIRFEMVKKMYQFPTLKQWLIVFAQTAVFLLLPSQILVYIYLISKDIIKIDEIGKKQYSKLSRLFKKTKNMAFS